MKILFAIKAMDNRGGGAERVLASVSSGLAARGHNVFVLSFDRPGGRSFYPLHERVERIPLGLGSTTERATLSATLRRVAALRETVKKLGPDVVVGFMHSMFIPLGLSLAWSGIPMVASEHIVPTHYRSRPLEALLLFLTPLLARRITCVSEQVRLAYPRVLSRKMNVIPNPVDIVPAGFADVSGRGVDKKILLSVGRLSPQKDFPTLIDAFANLADKAPQWILRIVGEGGERSKLEAMISERGMSDRIQLAGSVENMSPEYMAAHLFVLPSRYESFGLTTVEALAHGLPAVGFDDCQGTNQLIRPGHNGILATAGRDRADSLARALLPIMADDAMRLRLSQQSGNIPIECHLDSVLDRWEELLGKVANPPL